MPQGKLYVKLPKSSAWIDTYQRYGLSLEESALSKLMTPAPSKEFVENKSDLQHGKRVNRNTDNTKKDERNVVQFPADELVSVEPLSEFLIQFARDPEEPEK